MHGDEPFDIEKWKLPDTFVPATAPKPSGYTAPLRRRRGEQFVKVPLVWVDRLSSARNSATLKLAHHLLLLLYKDHRQTIRLANGALKLNGVTRSQKSRAIQELEALGLAKVEHRPRKSPEITLLFPKGQS
jgi:hypothetical protein